MGPVTRQPWLGAEVLSYPNRPRTILDALDRAVRLFPDRTYLVAPEGELTYREFAELVEGAAERLVEEGLGAGDRLAVAARNGFDLAVALWACARTGIVLVGLNIRLAPAQWGYMLEHSGATLALAQPEFLAPLQEVAGGLRRSLGRPDPAHRRPPHGPAPTVALRPVAAARRVEHLRGRVHQRHDRPTQGQPGRAPLQHAQRDHLQPGAPPHVGGPVGGALPALLHQRHARPPAPDHAGGRDVRARGLGHAGAVRDGPGRPGHHLGLRGAVVLAHAPPGARVRLAGAGRPDRRRVRRGPVPPVGPARAAPADAPDPVARHLRPLRDPLAGDDAHGRGVPPEAGLGGPAPAVHGGGGGRRRRRRRSARARRASCGSGARW